MPRKSTITEIDISTAEEERISIQPLVVGRVTLYLMGTSPLIMNRMPKKAREQLLLPAREKNRAEKKMVQKHNPPFEYRDSIYRCRDKNAPTLVHLPNGAIKKAISSAAIDVPGATKAEIGRLMSIITPTIHLYGTPMLYMAVVRQAGIARAPDIRTRAIFPEWCCEIELQYIRSLIREQDLVNLTATAGMIRGIGDGRTEKGSLDYGQWELCRATDPRWKAITKQARKVQESAMAEPIAYDEDTEELLHWYDEEIVRREVDDRRTPALMGATNGRGGRRRVSIEQAAVAAKRKPGRPRLSQAQIRSPSVKRRRFLGPRA